MRYFIALPLLLLMVVAFFSTREEVYDIIIRNGTIYDGSGTTPYLGDLGIQHDRIIKVGDLGGAFGTVEIDASGLAVAPGFINMLSWADESLLKDGRAISDIKQGVTLEVLGEGYSPGPVRRPLHKPPDSLWTSLGGYFAWLQKKGMSPNVASFVGATSVRIHELGFANRAPTAKELEQMKKLVQRSMEEGALGVSTSLIYPPASFASTHELVELCRVASSYGGIYITHLRSEGDFILEALDEAIQISSEASIPLEIYHLKLNIARNWNKIDGVLMKVDSARKAGMRITANMYPYNASATGLTSRLPQWVQAGGARAMRRRLTTSSTRKRVLHEMHAGIPYKNSDPADVLLTDFRIDALDERYAGKRLDEAAHLHGKSPDETTLDLIVADKSRIECIYFLQSENIVRKIISLPWVSFGSDAGAYSLDAEDLPDHPRAFGTFARVLGKYVREEKVMRLEEAIRRLTALPADNLGIPMRGRLRSGSFADVVIFDPAKITDRATFQNPSAYSEGMVHVFINGAWVLRDGEHTGAKPGRIIYGPGWTGRNNANQEK